MGFLDITDTAPTGVIPGVLDFHLLSRGIYDVHLHIAVWLYVNTPMGDVDIVGLRQPYMTVDATTGIPAGIGLVTIVDTHGNDIVATTQITCDIIFK